jgi:agmatinase
MIELPRLPHDPPRPPEPRDPNAPAAPRVTLFDLGLPLEQARVVAVPVPYQATVSSGAGTVDGPRALLEASVDIDLVDPAFGEPWREGIAALAEPEAVRSLSGSTERIARAARGGEDDEGAVDAAGRVLADWVRGTVTGLLGSGRKPLLIGGEHAVSLGAFEAAAAAGPLGLLQIDAHADLRHAYEGWLHSHASVMARALELDGVVRLVQVGLRDVSPEELARARAEPERVAWYPDDGLARRQADGERFASLAREIVERLPARVWLSLDVDGLDPALCPGTGTPVPGGLGWREVGGLLEHLRESGRELAGADLVEIGPGAWDGQVAARLAYRLAAVAAGCRPA